MISVFKGQLCDRALVLTTVAFNLLRGKMDVKFRFTKGIKSAGFFPINRVVFEGGQCSAICAHEFRDIRPDDGFL